MGIVTVGTFYLSFPLKTMTSLDTCLWISSNDVFLIVFHIRKGLSLKKQGKSPPKKLLRLRQFKNLLFHTGSDFLFYATLSYCNLTFCHSDILTKRSTSQLTVAELRSTENARCTITIRFVYEYATLYLLHAIPYVRMLRRVYDPKRVSPINYTIFPR